MSQHGFLSDILRRVAGSQRIARWLGEADETDPVVLCRKLMADQGEASGMRTAQRILHFYGELLADEKTAFFHSIGDELGIDENALRTAIAAWSAGDTSAARAIHFAAEPLSMELLRRINKVPGATAQLVAMRGDLLDVIGDDAGLRGLDEDFRHLFSSWFNRGFLEIRRIDWNTPANILEKIIRYEAVHEISGWDDLRQRVGDPDRRLFAFFHPAMPAEPLIFVEVALTLGVPEAIAPILAGVRERIDPDEASFAAFYSISDCQRGLHGISFGNFLIKQVVVELQQELPGLTTFVTLSPVPALRQWAIRAARTDDPLLSDEQRALILSLDDQQQPPPEAVRQLAARYLMRAKHASGTAFDPVAHFHLGNGALLHRVHAEADTSPRGLGNSWGVMVNYLYEGDQIETRHQAYATEHSLPAAAEVRALLGD